ncbi:MAG: TonB-dependent receptor [Candidatus Alcyoniella australis]|nr:TonB-dependent receptor [Candidatus Alcyoniella australis]
MRYTAAALLFAILLLPALVSGAQGDDPYYPPRIPDLKHCPTDRRTTAISTQVLLAGGLIALGMQNMAGAADRLAGGSLFNAHPGGRGIPGATLRLAGLPASRTAVFLDGIRLPSGTYGVDLQQLPLNAIDRIELLRGPRSTVYGAGAEAGVLRIMTRMPQLPPTASLDISYGSYNELFVTGHNSYKPNWFGYVLAIERVVGEGWSDEYAPGPMVSPEIPPQSLPSPETVRWEEGSYHSSNDILLKINADTGPLLVTGLGHYHYDRNTGKDKLGGNFNDRGYQFDYHTGLLVEPGIVDLTLSISGTKTGRVIDQVIPRLGYRGEPLPGVRRWPLTVDGVTNNESHRDQLGWGVDISRGQRIDGGLELGFAMFSGRYHEKAEDLLGGQPFGTDRINGALFVESHNELADSLLTLEPGARFELSDRYDPMAVGNLGLLLRLHPLVRLRLDGGRAWTEPALDRAAHDYLRERRLVVRGNPQLEPETSWGGTFELDLGPSDALWNINTAYFLYQIDDAIISLPADTWPDGTPTVEDRNVGQARSMGAFGTLQVQPLSWLTVGADYTFTHALLLELEDEQGDLLPIGAAPPHVAHLELGLEIKSIAVHLQARTGYSGEWQRRLPDGRLAWINDSYDLSARLSREFGEHIALFAEGYNLLGSELNIDEDTDNDLVPVRVMVGLRLAL